MISIAGTAFVSVVGVFFVTTGIAALLVRPRWFVWILAASVPFATTAAATFGENSISPYFVLSALATFSAVTAWLNGFRLPPRLTTALWWFFWVAVFVSATGPLIFRGAAVLVPRDGIDLSLAAPGELSHNISIVAQLIYLALGLGSAIYLAQRQSLSPHIVGLALGVGTGLSLLRYGLESVGLRWPAELFQNYASAGYINSDLRHKGIFSEPSYLAVFSLAALLFFFFAWRRSAGSPRLWYLALLPAAFLNLALSRSGTAVLAGAVLAVGFVVYHVARFLFNRGKVHPAGLFAFVLVVVAIGVNSRVLLEAWSVLDSRIETISFVNRFGADLFSLQLFLDTWGYGVGLGANRPSSFFTMLLSSVGIVGTALFVWMVARTAFRAAQAETWRPVVWSLIALLTAKVVAEPGLSVPALWFLFGGCLYAAKVVARQTYEEPQAGFKPTPSRESAFLPSARRPQPRYPRERGPARS